MAINFLSMVPYALGALGGYQGYRSAKDSGATGLGALLAGAGGAYGGYNLGTMVPGVPKAPMPFQMPNAGGRNPLAQFGSQAASQLPTATSAAALAKQGISDPSILDRLLRTSKDGYKSYDGIKIAALAGGIPYALGAFDQGPTDIYQPTYNVGYGEFANQRPGYTYIDPTTGQEKEYESIYKPEADPKNQGAFRSGPFAMEKTRLKSGGLAEIKKFNEGGINYLPSKVTHDENDSNNYVRATGYVEDGAGVGDKDEDTMLAQLADGEFVTRADGVLGAGIIAGANPNSFKDMRSKGAEYFYEQQKRYKRVFDLLKDSNGNSAKKEN
jgi:hypothetical protein